MLHQPDPEKAPDLLNGLIAIRKMHMHALETFEMPIADEMLYPEITGIWPMSFPTWLSVPALLKISSTVLSAAVSMCLQA